MEVRRNRILSSRLLNLSQIHLSSANKFAMPGSSASNHDVRVKRELSAKRESSPAEIAVKREPITEVRIRLGCCSNILTRALGSSQS